MRERTHSSVRSGEAQKEDFPPPEQKKREDYWGKRSPEKRGGGGKKFGWRKKIRVGGDCGDDVHEKGKPSIAKKWKEAIKAGTRKKKKKKQSTGCREKEKERM